MHPGRQPALSFPAFLAGSARLVVLEKRTGRSAVW